MQIKTRETATKIVEEIQRYQRKVAKYSENKTLTEKERESLRDYQKEKLISLVEVLLIWNIDCNCEEPKNEPSGFLKKDENGNLIIDKEKIQEEVTKSLIKKSEQSEEIVFIMELLGKS